MFDLAADYQEIKDLKSTIESLKTELDMTDEWLREALIGDSHMEARRLKTDLELSMCRIRALEEQNTNLTHTIQAKDDIITSLRTPKKGLKPIEHKYVVGQTMVVTGFEPNHNFNQGDIVEIKECRRSYENTRGVCYYCFCPEHNFGQAIYESSLTPYEYKSGDKVEVIEGDMKGTVGTVFLFTGEDVVVMHGDGASVMPSSWVKLILS